MIFALQHAMMSQRLAEAYSLATGSPDVSNQNGAVVYTQNGEHVSNGYNHFYDGIPPTEERPAKYERIVHAEADACLKSNQFQGDLSAVKTFMFCPWATCKPCAISVIGAGIGYLIVHKERCEAFIRTRAGQNEANLQEWQPDIDESNIWLRNAGVAIHRIRRAS